MGQMALIVALALALGVALFAIQNAAPVTVRFGLWAAEVSLVVVILVSAVTGAAAATLLGFAGWMRDRRRLRLQARELATRRAVRPDPPLTPPGPAP